MATFPTTFRADSAKVHDEHQAVAQELLELEAALDELTATADPAAVRTSCKVCASGRRLAEIMPEHFTREEQTVLATVAAVSPELTEFAREMTRQHDRMRLHLLEFCSALKEMEDSGREEAVARVKELGHGLAREMRHHITLEDFELDGFL